MLENNLTRKKTEIVTHNFDPTSLSSANAGILTDGNQRVELRTFGNSVRGMNSKSDGKWYFECTLVRCEQSNGPFQTILGIVSAGTPKDTPWFGPGQLLLHRAGIIYNNFVQQAYALTYTQGDVMGVAVDLSSNPKTVQFFRNGVAGPLLQLSTYVATNGPFFPVVASPNTRSATTSITDYNQTPLFLPAGFEYW